MNPYIQLAIVYGLMIIGMVIVLFLFLDKGE